MRREWVDPYFLEPRPNHRASESEQEEFLEAVQQLGLIAAHLGATLEFTVTFRLPRKRKPRQARKTPTP
jgi:hypothetical protein